MKREQIVNDSDRPLAIHGVDGRLTHRTVHPDRPGLWFKQRWVSCQRPVRGWGAGAYIVAEMRFDDECGNGRHSFAATATIMRPRASDIEAGGCLHEEIARYFPELTRLIKWHLVSSDGPLHYIANTIYHAGDRDCHGLKAGEFRQHTSRGPHQAGGVAGVPNWELEEPKECDVYSVVRPEPVVLNWVPSGRTGEGKKRELDHARSSAVWPEATDEQLMAEPEELRAALEDRHPQLMADFRREMEDAGFLWEVK